MMGGPQSLKNPLNYKIVKCKNFEKDGYCKYGDKCTFAHSDSELRNKNENLSQMQQVAQVNPYVMDYNMMAMNMPGMMPGMSMQQPGFDINSMNSMGQMNAMGQMGVPGQFEANPMMMGMNLNNFTMPDSNNH